MARAAKAAKAAPKRDLVANASYGEIGRTTSDILTPEGVVLPFINATFGERIGALLIDMLIIVFVPIIVFIIWIALPIHVDFDKTHKALSSFVEILLLFFMFFIRSGYFIFFEMGPKAATPGKRLMKLRVISHDGGRLTPAAIFTRNALREVELYLPVTLIGVFLAGEKSGSAALAALWALALLLLPLFNKQHARLGDFLAGTRVVHMPKAALSYDLADLDGDRGLGISFTTEQLAYGEMELSVLEQVLRERKPAVMKAVADKIKTRIGWVEPQNPEDVPNDENFLRAYYGALRAHLESRMLLGRRRKDKHDGAV
ncbi:hypothetical protein AEAC466_18025 [Asticcacaulis sp. AC466]|uniref:RDD family protein n=1 Tax=Asticcacaulis sp. AC466 TaxID=1282362 RepID=UPI0003C40C4D|nr:RDD family protein [Asticcacaulis sp. AC466]ESQ82244.1 hypothetical protein AEAC466_18025 [Asticcacaulis sp. AC466]